jgi:hypothetical protein
LDNLARKVPQDLQVLVREVNKELLGSQDQQDLLDKQGHQGNQGRLEHQAGKVLRELPDLLDNQGHKVHQGPREAQGFQDLKDLVVN